MQHLSSRRPRGALAVAALALPAFLLLAPTPAAAGGCGGGPLSTSTGNLVGSAVGGAAGGLLGNQFGAGTGKGVMTGLGVVGGALAGGYVGRQMEDCNRPAAQAPAAAPAAHTARRAAPAAVAAPVAAETRTCRSMVSQTVIDGREQPVEGIACLDPDGVWRTASGPAAERAAEADLVLRAQQRLREQGYYVRDNIDGRWGPATSNAVHTFQRANGLAATGQLDLATRAALGLDAAPVAAAAEPAAAPAPAAAAPLPAGTPAAVAQGAARAGN